MQRYWLLNYQPPVGGLPREAWDKFCFADIWDSCDVSENAVERFSYSMFFEFFMDTDGRYTEAKSQLVYAGGSNDNPKKLGVARPKVAQVDLEDLEACFRINLMVYSSNPISFVCLGNIGVYSVSGLEYVLNQLESGVLTASSMSPQTFSPNAIAKATTTVKKNRAFVFKGVQYNGFPNLLVTWRVRKQLHPLFRAGFADKVRIVRPSHIQGRFEEVFALYAKDSFVPLRRVESGKELIPVSSHPCLNYKMGTWENGEPYTLSMLWSNMLQAGYIPDGII